MDMSKIIKCFSNGWSLGKFGLEYFFLVRSFHVIQPKKQFCVCVEKMCVSV